MEISHPCNWHPLVGRRFVLLRSARLGHSDQFHHGRVVLLNGLSVNARHSGTQVAAMAIDGVLDVVHGRRVLLDLLAFQEPRGTGTDAHGKCTSFTFVVLDVWAGLVLPRHLARNVGRASVESEILN